MLWLELTALHLELKSSLTQVLVIGNLWFVGLGSILLNLLAWSAHRQKIGPNAIQPLIGAILLGYHCIINDAIIWNVMYFTCLNVYAFDLFHVYPKILLSSFPWYG